ncbi:MAG TPA: peptidylprolyl isomerase, partial [Bacillaceae bacterium]
VKVTDKELKEYYDNKQPDIEVRHILVDDEKTAKEVKARLDKGEDFAAVAKEVSKDPGTAEKGGDLGFVSQDDPALDQQFKDAAFKLEKDQISEPVESQFGWHIIQVTDKKEKEAFDKVKDKYEYELKVSKLDADKVQKALKDELEKAKVKVEDKDLKNTFDPILESANQQTSGDAEEEKK